MARGIDGAGRNVRIGWCAVKCVALAGQEPAGQWVQNGSPLLRVFGVGGGCTRAGEVQRDGVGENSRWTRSVGWRRTAGR